jgi:hypothetical protein
MNGAWNNDSSLKGRSLKRLTEAVRAQTLGQANTPFLVLLDGQGPLEAEAELSMPGAFAFLVDGIFGELLRFGTAENWACRLFDRIALNADLRGFCPGLMLVTLNAVKKLLSRMDRANLCMTEEQAITLLDQAIGIVSRAEAVEVERTDEAARYILGLYAHNPLNELAQAAVNAVLTVKVPTPEVLLDADKSRLARECRANQQAAGMSAMSALRVAAQLVVDGPRLASSEVNPEVNGQPASVGEMRRHFYWSEITTACESLVDNAPVVPSLWRRWWRW